MSASGMRCTSVASLVVSKRDRPGCFFRQEIVCPLLSLFVFLAALFQLQGAEITHLDPLAELPLEQVGNDVNFRCKGVVVCSDLVWGQLFIYDGQRVSYFDPRSFNRAPNPGQFVEITGTSTVSGGNRLLTNLTLTIRSSQPIPAAREVNLREIDKASGDWLETEGTIRVAETSRGRLALLIAAGGAECPAVVMGTQQPADPKALIGCKVRLRGVCTALSLGPQANRQGLMLAGTNDLEILEEPRLGTAQLPVTSIDSLLSRELGSWTNDVIHINGLVVSSTPGVRLVVKDPTGVLRARVLQVNHVQPNDRVDVWGFLALTPSGVILEDAFFEAAHVVPLAPKLSAQPFPTSSPTRTVTQIAEVFVLSKQAVAQGTPVRLEGTLTYADPDWKSGFLQDSRDAIYLQLSRTNYRAGQRVELTGRTGEGGFAPIILPSEIRLLGTNDFPAPARVQLDDLADGHLDAHWVELSGVVRRVTVQDGHLRLVLRCSEGTFKAVIPQFKAPEPPLDLIDAVVRIRGACGAELNVRGQLSGINLHVPSMAQVEITEPAPADPFSVPSTRVARIATFNPTRLDGRRLKVVGVVTLVIPGQGCFLQDSSGGIRINSPTTEQLRPGQVVEAIGFPALGDFSPRLEEVAWRHIGQGKLPEPATATPREILAQGSHDGMLVQLTAELLQRVAFSAQPRLVLQTEQTIFTASLPVQTASAGLTSLRPGSTLQLTGICSIQGTDRHEPQSFRLLLSGPQDVRLLHEPAPWTARQVLFTTGAAALVVLLVVAWIGLLHRQVRIKTEALQSSERFTRSLVESLPQNILRKDREGRFVFANNFFCRTIGRSMSEIIGRTDYDLYPSELAAKFRKDDEQVIASGKDFTTIEENRSPTGQRTYVEVIKTPLYDAANQLIGLQVVFWDVTARKEAEEQLEAAHKQLLETSRKAGMAEVATGVLHNVGNVLNSVNVSTNVIGDKLRHSKALSLGKVARLLREHDADLAQFLAQDQRGRHLPVFLEQLAERLTREQALILAELSSLTRNLEHIKNIVAMQQSYAKVAGVTETVSPVQLIEDALRLNAGALERHQVLIHRDYDSTVPDITVDKHKVLQVLINVIRNAKYACDEVGRPDKQMRVRVYNGNGTVKIAVTDNGAGIASENLIRIFNLGFTTRKEGHGFGLHSGALAAGELGGTLQAESDGPGRGATFTLELPLVPPVTN